MCDNQHFYFEKALKNFSRFFFVFIYREFYLFMLTTYPYSNFQLFEKVQLKTISFDFLFKYWDRYEYERYAVVDTTNTA